MKALPLSFLFLISNFYSLFDSDVEQQEIASLKEQLQCLLKDNQILRRAVAIQHERNIEHEEKLKEVQQLKHIISQYQEQIRTLEVGKSSSQFSYTKYYVEFC